jgi:hypothetical protein
MVSAVSALGNRPYARFVCRGRSSPCLISLQRRHSPLATRHSPPSFSRIIFPCNSFRSNTYRIVWKCSFQKTYSKAKSFSSNTYKKTGGGDPIDYLVASLHPCPLWSRRRAVGAPLFSHGNFVLCLFSSYRYQTPPVTTRGGTPPPLTASRSVTESILRASVSLWVPHLAETHARNPLLPAPCSASVQSACTCGQIILEQCCPSPPDSLSSPSYKMDLTRPKGLTRKE